MPRRHLRRPAFWLILLIVISLVVNGIIFHTYLPEEVNFGFNPAPGMNSNTYSRKSTNDNIPDIVLWQRRSLQEESYGECPNGRGRILESNSTALPGFSQEIRQYLQNSEYLHSSCFYPAGISCHTDKYSVVIFSQGKNLRQLMLNTLSFMSYPSVQDTTLVMDISAHLLKKNKLYGQRILDWYDKHSINLILQSPLWLAVANLQPKSEAVLWINGDGAKTWTATSLKHSFSVWKKKASSLIVTKVGSLGTEECIVPELDGAFIHRNFFCYFNHPVIQPLKRYTTKFTWEDYHTLFGVILDNLADELLSTKEPPKAITGIVPFQELQQQSTVADYFGCCRSMSSVQFNAKASTCDP
jgi:hypothetical protein